MADLITDTSAQLSSGHTYLLTFAVPPVNADILRKMASWADVSYTFNNRYIKYVDYELLGMSVTAGAGGAATEINFLCRVKGTPLLALVNPIVACLLIVAGVVLIITFKHAIDVTTINVGQSVKDIADSVGQGVEDLAQGVEAIGSGAGSGLKYGLPVIGIGLVALAGVYFFAFYEA